MTKYPNIRVRLSGKDGNAFAILGNVRRAMEKAKVPAKEVSEFFDEATSGDYDHLLYTCGRWVSVS